VRDYRPSWAKPGLGIVMLGWIVKQPWWVKAIIAVMIVASLFGAVYKVQAWAYHRGHAKYIEESQAWQKERAGLIASADAKEKQVAELETQIIGYKTAAEQGKKLDAAAAEKLDQVMKEAANEEAATELPAECVTRAERTCVKLASLNPPIRIDCAAYKRKICG